VAKLGEKAFTQCAGFVRVPGSKNVLDNTSVHPESYEATEKLLEHFGYSDSDVAEGKVGDIKAKLAEEGVDKVAALCGIGAMTLSDIVEELLKPSRDIRDSLPPPMLRKDLINIKDLQVGMEVDGTVRNVIDFGVFVDIGVHQDGLVHISEISDNYIKHPSDILKVGDRVVATILGVDIEKNKISLSLKKDKHTMEVVQKVAPQKSQDRPSGNRPENKNAGQNSHDNNAGNKNYNGSRRDNFNKDSKIAASSDGSGYKEYGANGKNTLRNRGDNSKQNAEPVASLDNLLDLLAKKYKKPKKQ
ncbi:MAG: S1 RNA-binding domain-containing protein, partial [Clostridia bacterium]